VFDEVYILFHFNIILKHNGMSSTKIVTKATLALKLGGGGIITLNVMKTRPGIWTLSDMVDYVCVSLFSDRFLRITEVE